MRNNSPGSDPRADVVVDEFCCGWVAPLVGSKRGDEALDRYECYVEELVTRAMFDGLEEILRRQRSDAVSLSFNQEHF